MWVSKKKWQSLEKRVADLEVQVRSQQERRITLQSLRNALGDSFRLAQESQPAEEFPAQIELPVEKKSKLNS